MKKYKFNEKADAYLKALYDSVGAITAEQQYNTLFMALGYHLDGTVVSFSHDPTWEQKRGMTEYELLEREGLIELVLA
jgi:hypothetical protein